MKVNLYILIIIYVLISILLAIKFDKYRSYILYGSILLLLLWFMRNKLIEGMASPDEACQNIASVYNGSTMTVQNLQVTGTLAVAGATTTSDVTIGGNLKANQNVACSTLNVGGVITTGSDINLSGSVNVGNGLNVKGGCTIGGNTQCNGTLNVNGETDLQTLHAMTYKNLGQSIAIIDSGNSGNSKTSQTNASNSGFTQGIQCINTDCDLNQGSGGWTLGLRCKN